jgi:hypothetical protein
MFSCAALPAATHAGDALSHLVKLTHLTLSGPNYDEDTPSTDPMSLLHIHHLRALVELNVEVELWTTFTAAAMSGLHHLTLLNLGSGAQASMLLKCKLISAHILSLSDAHAAAC